MIRKFPPGPVSPLPEAWYDEVREEAAMSTRRDFLRTMGAGAAALSFHASAGAFARFGFQDRPADLPNIVLMFTDDQGYADIGRNGAVGFETPNLDRLADEGIRFTDFYVSQAVCSASRSSLMTGCYAERVGIQGALMPSSTIGLNPDEETIADLLKARGYATAVFGKWHLGHHREFLPLRQGFDEYFGLPYSNDMWPVNYDGTPAVSGAKLQYPPLPLIEGYDKVGEIRTLDDQAKLTTLYTERAVRFIEKNARRPFFLYVPHSMPHVPLGVSAKFKGKSRQGPYGDVIMEIDWSMGEILKTLHRLDLDSRTLVIFASDNGPWLNYGLHAGSARPLREGKGTMWEGGARVPCLMRWPTKIPAGGVCGRIAASIDILPTIAAAAGASLPRKKIDGVSLWPLLSGDPQADPRGNYYYYYGGGLCAVREGPWKMMFPHRIRTYEGFEPGRNGFPGPTGTKKIERTLYNLRDDIGERTDVAAAHPDIVARLEELGESARKELGDAFTGRTGSGVRPPGRLGSARSKPIRHLAVGAAIKLAVPPSPKYPGRGENPLVDGFRGSLHHADGYWQGFEGTNVDAVVDMGKVQSVRRVTASFLQSQGAWIFLPEEVDCAVSEDGMKYDAVGLKKETPVLSGDVAAKDYVFPVNRERVRFVRLRAKNIGVCPKDHPGAGGKAWLFIDEIVVE
jgi:arylsulfatase A-like enzyme